MSLEIFNQWSGSEVILKVRDGEQDHVSTMNKSILIIDDDPPVRRAVCLLLESHGFDCKEAENGLEALALLDRGLLVDVILSDYHMPGIDGRGVLKALTYRVSGQAVTVILLSGNVTKKIEREAKQTGAFAVLAKPYDSQALLAAISRACNLAIS